MQTVNGDTHSKPDAVASRLIRIYLERVAAELETRAGNAAYKAAWRLAAKVIRANKPD